MDLEFKDYYNKIFVIENSIVVIRNVDFSVWDDYKSSVDDL